ncbi:MAG: hypothetical protein ACP5D2_00020 [Candidatus Nanoarchaeia archaeon]
MTLDKQGKLTNGVYRDYEIAVFSAEEPNSEVAQSMVEQAQGEELPFIIPFRAMTHEINKDYPYGIALNLTDPDKIKTGRQAEEVLANFIWGGYSGAQRVCRYADGGWNANWNRLDYSLPHGRMAQIIWLGLILI